jgi:hypothetical protein
MFLGIPDPHPDPYLDSYKNVTDPQHCLRDLRFYVGMDSNLL